MPHSSKPQKASRSICAIARSFSHCRPFPHTTRTFKGCDKSYVNIIKGAEGRGFVVGPRSASRVGRSNENLAKLAGNKNVAFNGRLLCASLACVGRKDTWRQRFQFAPRAGTAGHIDRAAAGLSAGTSSCHARRKGSFKNIDLRGRNALPLLFPRTSGELFRVASPLVLAGLPERRRKVSSAASPCAAAPASRPPTCGARWRVPGIHRSIRAPGVPPLPKLHVRVR